MENNVMGFWCSLPWFYLGMLCSFILPPLYQILRSVTQPTQTQVELAKRKVSKWWLVAVAFAVIGGFIMFILDLQFTGVREAVLGGFGWESLWHKFSEEG
jgi:hypothetical protein